MAIPNTPGLDLRRFDSTEAMLYTEVNTNAEKIEAGILSDVYTTATRPTLDLFVGKQIINSDTDKVEFWDGAAWITWPNQVTPPAQTSYADLTGTTAARPASGSFVGQRYYDTTKKQWFDWDNTAWVAASGVEQTFTPTWTNMPVPSAQTARYSVEGIWCSFEVIATLSGPATGQIGFTLPVTSVSYPAGWIPLGVASMKDAAGVYIMGQLAKMNNAAGALGVCAFYFPASSTNTNATTAGATTPFTAAAGDSLAFQGRYKIA